MRRADVSVIVPAYRAAGTIRRALESIALQTVRPKEAIVVDDGSPDSTAETARTMEPALGDIALRVIRQERAGPGAARNRALAEASGKLVAFLDADDEWLPAKLERSLAHLTDERVLVAHDGFIVGADGAETPNLCARRFGENRDPFVTLYRKGFIDTCSVVARRDAVLAAGGFDENLANAQDFDLWLRMLARPGVRFVVFAEPLVRYHLSPEGVMSHVDRRLACGLEIARRHAPALRLRPGWPLISLAFRALAVHFEAATAHRARGRRLAALKAWLGFPASLVRLSLDHVAPEWAAEPSRPWVAVGPWLWIGLATAAYLVQFRDLIGPVARTIGIPLGIPLGIP